MVNLQINSRLGVATFTVLDRILPAKRGLMVKQWYCRYRTRRQLLLLTAEQLDDIGITQVQAIAEAGRPFWK